MLHKISLDAMSFFYKLYACQFLLQVSHLGGKLDELCRIMAARKERRDTRRSSSHHTDTMRGGGAYGHQDDLMGGD